MTDYHDELGRHLDDAARRQARWRGLAFLPRPRGALVLAFVAMAAVVVVAVAVALSGAGTDAEREVAAPPAPLERPCRGGDRVPAELPEAFAILRSAAAPGDAAGREAARAAADQDHPGAGRPQAVFVESIRLARRVGDREFWVVPLCDAKAQPGLCFVLVERGPGIPSCGSLADAREGRLAFMWAVRESEWSHTALLPDDRTRAEVVVGDERYGGTIERNVFHASYSGTAEDHERARLDLEGSVACGDPVATQDPAPATIVERFAVLRQPPDPPTDFELDRPEVRRIYAAATRIARFGSGARAFVIPVEIGDCEPPDLIPAVCVVPMDRGFETACFALPARKNEPFAAPLTRPDERGGTEVIAVVTDAVAAVEVTSPRSTLRVEPRGGTVAAHVDAPPEAVTVVPAD